MHQQITTEIITAIFAKSKYACLTKRQDTETDAGQLIAVSRGPRLSVNVGHPHAATCTKETNNTAIQ